MDKKPVVLYKTLVVGIILLFIGVAVQPSVATIQPEEKINAEPKDYLFQTIIDIVNNADVKDLLEPYNHKLFTSDYDYKGVFSKLMLRNPRILFSMLFTKPSITYDYLDKCYNGGIEITNILGEDKTLEMLESIEVTNQEVLDELNNIIINDEEISDRIAILEEMNKEIKPKSPLENNSLICGILTLIVIPTLVITGIYLAFALIFKESADKYPNVDIFQRLYERFMRGTAIFGAIAIGCGSLMILLNCPYPDIP